MKVSSLAKKTILCVDDEVLLAMDLSLFLEDLGFERVLVAHTRASALRLAQRHRIDLAILDVNLGHGETSFDIAKEVNSGGGTSLFVTGYSTLDMPPSLAGSLVLEKPLKHHVLEEVLHDIAGGAGTGQVPCNDVGFRVLQAGAAS